MKKIFQLQPTGKNPERVLEAIKNEIRKYLKRERSKKLPAGVVFWDFDCRVGNSSEDAAAVTATEIITALDKAHAENKSECFVEIFTKPSLKKREISTEE